MQWLTQILIPYRISLNKQHKKILLILDGHSTHTVDANLTFCQQNDIVPCLLPAHTSHITQPLDVGIFNSYKAAYRQCVSNNALDDIRYNWTSEATRNRVNMLGRALIANTRATLCANIKRAFYHTGIYPFSFNHFIFYTHSVSNVPPEVRDEAKRVMEQEREANKQRILNKGRVNVYDQIVLVADV